MSNFTLTEVEALARSAHADQVDKAGRPYAEHLAAVAQGVAKRGGDEEQVAAAWLHDAIEDGVLSPQWLADAALSERTKALVLAMTKRPGEDPRTYAARIRSTPGALEIKHADMAHNANPQRLAALDPATRTRLTLKYARMRRLLHQDVTPAAGTSNASKPPREGDPGDAVLLAQLDRSRTQAWQQLGALVREWRSRTATCAGPRCAGPRAAPTNCPTPSTASGWTRSAACCRAWGR